jgi:hypothetical protein
MEACEGRGTMKPIHCLGVLALLLSSCGPTEPEPPASHCLDSPSLATRVLQAVREADFASTWDLEAQATIARTPNVDVAVIAFQEGCAPAMANVLLSHDAPQGHVASLDAESLAVTGVTWRPWSYARWEGQQAWDAPWAPEATVGPAHGALNHMVPNPVSLFKLLVGVGVMMGVDEGRISLSEPLSVSSTHPESTYEGTVGEAMALMLSASDNATTSALIKRLHAAGLLPHALHERLGTLGLHTLRIDNTRPDGSWRPPEAVDTTGAFHMTSWDTARLLWLLDEEAPAPGWKVGGAAVDAGFLSASSKQYLRGLLEEQGWHEVLSTTATCGIEGREPGIPAVQPRRWLNDPEGGDHGVTVEGIAMTADVRACNAEAEVRFAHKTGLSEGFGSDAGIVRGLEGHERHYVIALTSNLGFRYTDRALSERYSLPCFRVGLCYTQRIATLGRTLDAWLRERLQAPH